MPLFSIAIPTYNRLEMLKRAVFSALKQTYKNIEIIILNNASTDGTEEWLNTVATQYPKIRLIHRTENIGMVKNIKSIPQLINGEYVVVLSDDDWLEPTFAEEAAKDLIADDKATVWYCRTNVFYIDKCKKSLSKPGPVVESGLVHIKNALLGKRSVWFCATVYKTQVLRKTDGFLGKTVTIDTSSRFLCMANGNVIYNDKILANYSCYSLNLTHSSSCQSWIDAYYEIYDLIEKHIGKQYKIYCACSATFGCIDITNRYGYKNGLRCFMIFLRRFHIYFLFYLLRKLPIFCASKLLPMTLKEAIKNCIEK